METGKVAWFNNVKGFGFIKRQNGSDIFVHYSGIAADGYKKLIENQEVQFEIEVGPKGQQATNVVVIGG